ncbi:Oxoglutarate and iron-dependent oxygenase degradation C-term-domain-containing protein [Lipomyces chichibuensis]|uniref:Oxoglutarate and iron-dependent oxygenase degradation C-term-domain-containing protein n=1 Tax=Lipomyces chichibuensis TaxID=1546026 RepID=UPI003343AAFE
MATAANPRKRLRSVSPASSVASGATSLRGSTPITVASSAVFAPGLFDKAAQYHAQHASSRPYKHCIIDELVSDALLLRVRREITTQLHFTPKETDIYKLHQTGDLLNISGLSSRDKEKLSALHSLRDSMYSSEFRAFITEICDCGPLSGLKQDMSINCYVKGSHLLTHDDVIGSRRVSYILYLPDPEDKDCEVEDEHGRNLGWDPAWGGALRLYEIDAKGAPKAEWNKVVPPAWNQLTFFVVQPGVSFHDVQEVVFDKPRLAISGWFHLPQKGEDGYIEGLQESLNLESSRAALADAAAAAAAGLGELPSPALKSISNFPQGIDRTYTALTQQDIEFLAATMNPKYLDVNTILKSRDEFVDLSLLELEGVLNDEFAAKLRQHIEELEKSPVPVSVSDAAKLESEWRLSRPPHKHRYLYIEPSRDAEPITPIQQLVAVVASQQFRKWLTSITGVGELTHSRVLARRFRQGLDYTLATTSLNPVDETGTAPIDDDGNALGGLLEGTICITPTIGWDEGEFGGYDLYMDDGTANDDQPEQNGSGPEHRDSDDDENDPAVYLSGSRSKRRKELEQLRAEAKISVSDAGSTATWEGQANVDELIDDSDDDAEAEESAGDSVLLTSQAKWNVLTIVYRDPGVLKFVKYVSQNAPGSRWDVTGEWKPTYNSREETAASDSD